MSADGSIVAGESEADNGREAFIWDEGNGMRSLQDLLTADYGIDLTGWHLRRVSDMTPDGSTLVGLAINPAGDYEGYVAQLPPPGPGVTVAPNSG